MFLLGKTYFEHLNYLNISLDVDMDHTSNLQYEIKSSLILTENTFAETYPSGGGPTSPLPPTPEPGPAAKPPPNTTDPEP